MISIYYRILHPVLSFLDARHAASVPTILAGFAAYHVLLIAQLKAFEGSLFGSEFFTAKTVFPWALYVVAGLFAAPFLVQCRIARAATEPKEHTPGVLTALLLGLWVFVPYVVVQYYAQYWITSH